MKTYGFIPEEHENGASVETLITGDVERGTNMHQTHLSDENGNPAGGITVSPGLQVIWQNGPLVHPETKELIPRNGAFVEDLLNAALGRMDYYQSTKFNCQENAEIIHHIKAALAVVDLRQQNREQRNVRGTHQV